MYEYIAKLKTGVNKRRVQLRVALGIVAVVPISVLLGMVGSYAVIHPWQHNVLSQEALQTVDIPVGMVLGAGITNDGKPYKELQARLDVAAHALLGGHVQKLILSGDNRYEGYDEPTAMVDYLVSTYHISEDKLQPDYAGRSTYESCQRAHDVFRQDQLIIFSAGSHLPRAIYLCQHFGITAYGVSSNVEANNAGRRETMARVKALYNVYIKGEPTVLGEPIAVTIND